MRAILGVAAAVLALAMVGCGDEDDGCEEVKAAKGKTYCAPELDSKQGICVRDPKLEGYGKACRGISENCSDGAVLLYLQPIDGEMLSWCKCVGKGAEEVRACNGEPVVVEPPDGIFD